MEKEVDFPSTYEEMTAREKKLWEVFLQMEATNGRKVRIVLYLSLLGNLIQWASSLFK